MDFSSIYIYKTVSTDLRKYTHPRMLELFKIPDELHESGTQPALPTGYGSSPRMRIALGEIGAAAILRAALRSLSNCL